MKNILVICVNFQFIIFPEFGKRHKPFKKIDETSGLEIIDGQFITHNDSGDEAKLYYLDKKGVIVHERNLHKLRIMIGKI